MTDRDASYTHEQLWELCWKWWDIAKNLAVDGGSRAGYKECADQLSELLGPFAYAAAYAYCPDCGASPLANHAKECSR